MRCNSRYPDAVARIRGGQDMPGITGEVRFYQERGCVLVVAELSGFPENSETGFYGFHIHDGESCSGTDFSESGSHYNPDRTGHPKHAGDLPPLMQYGTCAYLAVKTERFTVNEITGKTVIIHSMPDDFHSQPSGNAGEKIACGLINKQFRHF